MYGGSHSRTRVRRKRVDQTGPTGAQQGPNQVPPGLDARNGRPLAVHQWGENHSALIKLLPPGAVFHRQHQLFFSPFFLRLCFCSFGRTGSANIHSFPRPLAERVSEDGWSKLGPRSSCATHPDCYTTHQCRFARKTVALCSVAVTVPSPQLGGWLTFLLPFQASRA